MKKCLLLFAAMVFSGPLVLAAGRPNVILVMTDDQGYGEVGFHGNPVLKTPNLDRFAEEGLELTQFYVSPMCTPTRSSLMTGRYHFRTGAHDTYIGRSNMKPQETTIAEVFAGAGYRAGIFAKWHLGENYPMRAQDQGFQEVVVHGGGGFGQFHINPGGLSVLANEFKRRVFQGVGNRQFSGFGHFRRSGKPPSRNAVRSQG